MHPALTIFSVLDLVARSTAPRQSASDRSPVSGVTVGWLVGEAIQIMTAIPSALATNESELAELIALDLIRKAGHRVGARGQIDGEEEGDNFDHSSPLGE
jgi:hypothetical protein